MDSDETDDTEGAERPHVDAKNDARSRKVREEEARVATASTQGETNGAATYVTPPRPAATAPPSPLRSLLRSPWQN
jgi:hypothetical protein